MASSIGTDHFMIRLWNDKSLTAAFGDDRKIELICESCGYIEQHIVALLDNSQRTGDRPADE